MPYPDWVLKHKKPGMYVQKKDDHTYRIYRGHSERRPDKPYPVLVTDEYIGTITKEKGLIPAKVTIKGEVFQAVEASPLYSGELIAAWKLRLRR